MDLFTFDINQHDITLEGPRGRRAECIALIKGELIITLPLDAVDASSLFGYYDRVIDTRINQYVDRYITTNPDEGELVEFMRANASFCILHIDKANIWKYGNEIAEAERLGMRVIYEPETKSVAA